MTLLMTRGTNLIGPNLAVHYNCPVRTQGRDHRQQIRMCTTWERTLLIYLTNIPITIRETNNLHATVMVSTNTIRRVKAVTSFNESSKLKPNLSQMPKRTKLELWPSPEKETERTINIIEDELSLSFCKLLLGNCHISFLKWQNGENVILL